MPGEGYPVMIDSSITIDGGVLGITDDSDLITLSEDSVTIRGTISAISI